MSMNLSPASIAVSTLNNQNTIHHLIYIFVLLIALTEVVIFIKLLRKSQLTSLCFSQSRVRLGRDFGESVSLLAGAEICINKHNQETRSRNPLA